MLDEGEKRVSPERLEELVCPEVNRRYSFDLTEVSMKLVGLSEWMVSFRMSIRGSESFTSRAFSGLRIKMLFSG